MESAEHHASIDPERYWLPEAEAITARYREGRQHPSEEQAITLVAELDGEIVGFVDARLDRSPDPMHRDILYCHVVEIAVSRHRQGQRIGERLLQAAEEWGRSQGAEFALLEYNAANPRAGDFYRQRMSYRTAGHIMVKWL
jgi:GNAT superfamily N-acetyltransferase